MAKQEVQKETLDWTLGLIYLQERQNVSVQEREHVSKELNWFDSFFDYLIKMQLEHLETTSEPH